MDEGTECQAVFETVCVCVCGVGGGGGAGGRVTDLFQSQYSFS